MKEYINTKNIPQCKIHLRMDFPDKRSREVKKNVKFI